MRGDQQGRVLRRCDRVVLRETGPARARASRTVRAAAGVLPAGSRASNAVHRPRKPTRLIDVSHTIEHGMVTYPGLPAPAISDWLSRDASQSRYAPGTTFQIGKIEMLANTGTYIDAPFHRYDGRQDIGDYPLESVADLEGVVICATERKGRALADAGFGGNDVGGKAGLVHRWWDAD